jgi:hypothetical protein
MIEELTISEMVAVKAVAQKPIAFCYRTFDNNIPTNQGKFRKHNAQQVKNKKRLRKVTSYSFTYKSAGG